LSGIFLNLVEKECPHLTGTEDTAAGSDGLGQIPAFVAEQLSGELFTAEIGAIDGQETLRSAHTPCVNGFGCQFFSGARFAAQGHRAVQWRHALNIFTQVLHGRRFTDNAQPVHIPDRLEPVENLRPVFRC
jgi:hypothetical protein